jgi:hypothetical protein
MPGVGFEPTIPVFDEAKMVHALDQAANVIGFLTTHNRKIRLNNTASMVQL